MARAVGKPSTLAIAALACVGLAAASLLLPSGPTYDPYQWLIWGRDLAHLDFVTRGTGTSWKPLPAIIAALLDPLGHGQASGWLVIARGGGLFAAFMAFRLAVRLSATRWAWPAGITAAATLVLTHEYVRRTAVGNAEGLTAALALLAVDRHLDGRRGQAFALGIAAGLMRPECWPFLLAYGGWLWVGRVRPPRWRLAVGGALIPLLWFGGDWIGSGRLSTASDRALHPVAGAPGTSPHPALAVFEEAWRMLPLPARVALPLAVGMALTGWLRTRAPRDRTALALAGGALAWTGVVAAMAQRGYPGLPRFLFVADGLAAALAGVGVARVAELLAVPSVRLRIAAATAALLAFAAAATPDAVRLRADASAIDTVADRDAGLAAAVSGAGGADAVLDCGHPYTGWFAVTALAYDLGVQADRVHSRPHGRRPVVFALSRGVTGLRAPLPMRHVRVADSVDGWNVVERCPATISSAKPRARRDSARAGSRPRDRPAAHT